MKPKALFSFFLCLVLSSCAGTNVKVTKAYKPSNQKLSYRIVQEHPVPEKALKILRARLNSALSSKGMLAKGQTGRKVEIRVKNYYMRHGATRALVGIMAGRDQILSSVAVLEGGKELARFEVDSKNPNAWQTSQDLIRDHADEIVLHLTKGS